MILGGGKLLKSLKQETGTGLLSGSLKWQSLVMLTKLMLPEGQSGVILRNIIGPKCILKLLQFNLAWFY